MNDPQRPPLYRTRALLPLALGCAALVLYSTGFHPSHLADWLDGLGPWGPVVFVVAGTAMMSMFIPKTAVSITSGALFGPILGSAVILLTAVAAAATNFAIGRWWLHLWVAEQQNRYIDAMRRVAFLAGVDLHLLFRLAPVPTSIISYTMGASGARVTPFLVAATIGVIPQWLWVYTGHQAASLFNGSSSPLSWIGLVISIVAAVALAFVLPREISRRLDDEPAPAKQ